MSMKSMFVNQTYASIVIAVLVLLGCDTRTEEQKAADEAAEYYKRGMALCLQGDRERGVEEIYKSAEMGNEQAEDELVKLIGNGEIPYKPYGSRADSITVFSRFRMAAQKGDVSAKRTYAKFLVKKATEDESNGFILGMAFIPSIPDENCLRNAYDYMSEVVAEEQKPEDKTLLDKIRVILDEAVKEKNRKTCVGLRTMRDNYLRIRSSVKELNEKSETMTSAQYEPIREQWVEKVNGARILVQGRVEEVYVFDADIEKGRESSADVYLTYNDDSSICCEGFGEFVEVAKTLNKNQVVTIIGMYDAKRSISSAKSVTHMKYASLISEDISNMALKGEEGN